MWGEASSGSESEEEPVHYSDDSQSSDDEDDDLFVVKECVADLLEAVEVGAFGAEPVSHFELCMKVGFFFFLLVGRWRTRWTRW